LRLGFRSVSVALRLPGSFSCLLGADFSILDASPKVTSRAGAMVAHCTMFL
jgi:hypothetical protein